MTRYVAILLFLVSAALAPAQTEPKKIIATEADFPRFS
jgi:hypothetical protein